MRPDNFNVQDIIHALLGTCSTIDEHLPEGMEFNDLTEADHDDIDNEIFLCDQCGWWCEIGERNGEGDEICNDCNSDFENDQ